MTSIGLACVRLAIAVVLFAHGCHKLFGAFVGPGIGPGGVDNTAAQFAAMSLQPAFFLAVAAGLVQFLGAFMIGIGWFTRWAAIGNLIYLLIGIWKEHAKFGLFLNWTNTPGLGHGVEYSIVLIAVMVMFALAGPGDYSIDGRRQRYVAARAAGRARLRRA